MKLTIIIPVYNAEKYLKKCLESIFNQDIPSTDYEVIAVDDGSTDNSLKILNKYKATQSNLIVISQKNLGEAGARNSALKIAKGDYITFLDNDDYYNEDAIRKSLEIIKKENLDVLYLKINHISEDYQYITSLPNLSNGEVFRGLLHERRPFPATVYRKKIIANTLFPLDILVGTDSVFNAIIQSKAERVLFAENCIYNYLVRPNSLSKKALTDEGYNGFVNAINILDQFKKQNFSENNIESKNYFDKVILVFITRIVELHILPSFNEEKYNELKSLLGKKGYLYLINNISNKYSYYDQSFIAFKAYQKWLQLKSKIYNLVYHKN